MDKRFRTFAYSTKTKMETDFFGKFLKKVVKYHKRIQIYDFKTNSICYYGLIVFINPKSKSSFLKKMKDDSLRILPNEKKYKSFIRNYENPKDDVDDDENPTILEYGECSSYQQNIWKFICLKCSCVYKHKKSLKEHQMKICSEVTDDNDSDIIEGSSDSDNDSKYIETTEKVDKSNQNNNQLSEKDNIIIKMIEDNRKVNEELLKQNQILQNKIIEISKENTNQIIINNTINNKKQINIIQFLQSDCKDAYNLTDFIKNMQISYDDLDMINQQGYLQNIRNLFIKTLSDTELTKRPIHCTDTKRKQFYVKDNDTWNKDKCLTKITGALDNYNNNQLKTLDDWKKENPNWKENQDKQDKVNNITKEITTMYLQDNDRLKSKIISELGQATTIDPKTDNS